MTENTYGDMGLPPAGYPPVPGQPGSWTRGYDPVVSPPPTTGGWTPAPAPNPVYAPSPTPAWTPTRSAPDTPVWDAPPPARSAPAPSPAYNQDWSAPVASAGPSRATPDPWSAAPAPAPARSAAPAPSWPQTPDWNAAPQAPSRGVAEMTVPAPQAAWDAVPSDTKRRWDPLADDAPVADDAWQGNDYTADATGYEAWSNDEYNTADPVVPDQEYAVDDDVYYQDAATYPDTMYREPSQHQMSRHQTAQVPHAEHRGVSTWVLIVAIVAVVVLVAGVIFWYFSKSNDAPPPANPTSTSTQDGVKTRVFKMKVGDCFNFQAVEDSQFVYAWVLECTASHDSEVFYVGDIPADTYPTDEEWSTFTTTLCSPIISTYLADGWDPTDLGSQSIYPSDTAWAAGTKTMVCFVQSKSGPVTQSITTPKQ